MHLLATGHFAFRLRSKIDARNVKVRKILFRHGQHLHDHAQADEEKGKIRRAHRALPKHLRAHVHLAFGGAGVGLGLFFAQAGGLAFGLSVAVRGGIRQELGQLALGLGELIVVVHPQHPLAILLVHIIGDAVGVEIIPQPLGFLFI